jgi:hypothetical protein
MKKFERALREVRTLMEKAKDEKDSDEKPKDEKGGNILKKKCVIF